MLAASAVIIFSCCKLQAILLYRVHPELLGIGVDHRGEHSNIRRAFVPFHIFQQVISILIFGFIIPSCLCLLLHDLLLRLLRIAVNSRVFICWRPVYHVLVREREVILQLQKTSRLKD